MLVDEVEEEEEEEEEEVVWIDRNEQIYQNFSDILWSFFMNYESISSTFEIQYAGAII